jgi:hypothetical protein
MNHCEQAQTLLHEARHNPLIRWRPVFAFYAAMHAFIHKTGRNDAEHKSRNHAVRTEQVFARIRGPWEVLNQASHRMRYLEVSDETVVRCNELAAKAEFIVAWAGIAPRDAQKTDV